MPELPDWLRGVALLGKHDDDYLALATDASGQLYVVAIGADGAGTARVLRTDDQGRLMMVAYGTVEIGGEVDTNVLNTTRQVQGSDGVDYRTLAVDANGQIIMVPRGQSGNYLAVDADGYLGAILKATAEVAVAGNVTVDQADAAREIQGADGATLRTVVVDANGQIIMVPRGQSGNYMAVDANGYLTSVMKGSDAGTLRTLAVDANGQLLGVLKGAYGAELKIVAVDADGRITSVVMDDIDQWGNVLQGGFAELAARLGSLVGYERRGQVMYSESFGGGFGGWVRNEIGTGTVALFVGDFISEGYSVKLETGVGAGNFCGLVRTVGAFPASASIGLSLWARFKVLPADWYLALSTANGTSRWTFTLKGTSSNGKLYYKNSGGTYTECGTWYTGVTADTLFRFVKVVGNPATDDYVRCIIDGTEIDLSGIDCYKTASTNKDVQLSFAIYADAATAGTVYVDNVVLTTMES